MRREPRVAFLFFVWASVIAGPLRVRAQDSASPAAASGLVPPKLIAESPAPYPEAAKAERLEADVVVQITIDVDGHVSDAHVVEPVGHGFDEAATEAALGMRFEPALDNGVPIAAKIRFSYHFQPEYEYEHEYEYEREYERSPRSSPPPAAPTEVTIAGQRSAVQRLLESAEAVNVVDTRRAKQQTVDLGEVLARSQGVAVRRDGGLGSNTRFSLNGLYDEQVRFFLDGVPLDVAGFPNGIANVPVNFVEHVEIYRGVVPIRFGADALGGAVNIVTDQSYEPRLSASYQVGSFGMHRLTLDGRYLHKPSGFIATASAFLDRAKNNYWIDVEIPDERGRVQPATVRRFHDAYHAYGVTLELGVIDRPWAKKLILRGTMAGYDKELQHNVVMKVPYGEVEYGDDVSTVSARYEVSPHQNLNVQVMGSYARRSIDFVDKSRWVYNWRGERVKERSVPGEIEGRGHDQTTWQDSVFARSLTTWTIAPEHTLRLSLTPVYTTRHGEERLQNNPDARDPLTAQRDLFTFVSGLEYELNLFGDRLSNIFFLKDYYYSAQSEEPLPGMVFKKRDSRTHTQGIGNSLRLRVTPWLYTKVSYEFATRLPTPFEVFGNGMLIMANLDLEPEISHNGNFGPRLELKRTTIGDVMLDVNAFIRDSTKLIVLLGSDRFFSYQNMYGARSMGVENALSWTSPGAWLSADGQWTVQDQRNTSDQGAFADFPGDRIPNRPWLFGSWGLRARVAHLPRESDTLEPFYNGRYVHWFFRGWESQGLRDSKQRVPTQVTHSVGLSYTLARDFGRITTTVEIDNLTDAKVFDNYGTQRPGRAFYFKVMGDLR